MTLLPLKKRKKNQNPTPFILPFLSIAEMIHQLSYGMHLTNSYFDLAL